MNGPFETHYGPELRRSALAVGFAAAVAVVVVALFNGRGHALTVIVCLAGIAAVLVNISLSRADGKSVVFGAITVVNGCTEQEIEDVDYALVLGNAVYAFSMLAMAAYLAFDGR